MIRFYTKDYCPYCVRAKYLLESIEANFEEINITHRPDVFQEIYAKSRMRTLPQIFVGEVCLGGYDEIALLHQKGELIGLLGLND